MTCTTYQALLDIYAHFVLVFLQNANRSAGDEATPATIHGKKTCRRRSFRKMKTGDVALRPTFSGGT